MSLRFRLFRVRSPLLAESLLFSSPPGTEMVHFPGFALAALCVQAGVLEYCSSGFPHSEIGGSQDACSSPPLIAACHVLRRLDVPRHPPSALSSLTIKSTREQRSTSESHGRLHSFLSARSLQNVLTDNSTIRLSKTSHDLKPGDTKTPKIQHSISINA